MRSEYRFYTEAKEATTSHKHGTPSSHYKAAQFSMNDHDFNNRLPAFTPYKYLTIKIHEASLLVDVSLFGKMTLYASIVLGNVKWNTNIDKEFHMNPKWNESKTFDLQLLSKKDKDFDKSFGSIGQKKCVFAVETHGFNSATTVDSAKIYIQVFHNSFFQDSEIGTCEISLKELLRAKSISDWFVLQNKKDIVGNILISMNLEYGDEDIKVNASASISKHKGRDNISKGDLQGVKHTLRLQTEAPERSKSPHMAHPKTTRNQSHVSQGSMHKERSDSTLIKRHYDNSAYQSRDFGNPQKNQPNTSGKSNRTRSNQQSRFEREHYAEIPQTLITYENNDVDIDMINDAQNFYDQFFNTKGEEKSEELEVNECDIPVEQADEGLREIKTYEYNYDSFKDASEIQRILDSIKRDNIEIKSKDLELKQKFEMMKVEYEKLMKERVTLESKQNALLMREQCLNNERKNLSDMYQNLKFEQNEFKNYTNELDDLKQGVESAKMEEAAERQKTIELENKIKELSVYYQRETQNQRKMENDMYKRLIAQKIQEFSKETYGHNVVLANGPSVVDEPMTEEAKRKRILGSYGLDEKCNLDLILIKLKQKSSYLSKELQKKTKNIEYLRDHLKNLD